MLVAALSTVVEWYDFTLYLYLATVLSRVFFGGGETSLLATLAGFAVSYGMRPLGAMQFPGEGRLSGLALGVTVATAIFGGLIPFLAELFVHLTGWTALPGAMIAAVALAVMPVLLTMPETQPRP